MRETNLIIDCFAGGGGASVGIEMAVGRSVDIAVNHDPQAIRMHTVNHPKTLHLTEDIFEVDLQKYVGVVDNKSSTTMKYANMTGANLSYPVYTINSGTSPEWVSIPLAKKNHNVIVFETAQNDTQYDKIQTARELVRTIDAMPIIQ